MKERGTKVLVVVATAAEAGRLSGLPARVVVCGVGPVAAALATQRALMGGPRPELVVSAGIGGAYVHAGGVPVGQAAVASELLYGDLGAWDGPAFLGLADLGLSVLPDGPETANPDAASPKAASPDVANPDATVPHVQPANPGRFPAWSGSAALAARLGLACGPFVTVSGVTGSREGAEALLRRVPGALVEGMEGAGVAQAALQFGVPCTEIRGVSNLVGPRDRSGWQIGAALGALTVALHGLLTP